MGFYFVNRNLHAELVTRAKDEWTYVFLTSMRLWGPDG